MSKPDDTYWANLAERLRRENEKLRIEISQALAKIDALETELGLRKEEQVDHSDADAGTGEDRDT